ncbi:MAG: thioredoxin domain-containing protein [Saprospiraceae bacterium]
MRSSTFFLFLVLLPLVPSCSHERPPGTLLPATAFSEQLQANPDAVVLDVRTPEEFAKGHLPKALSVNWNGDDFDGGIAALDKSKPVFVYCLGGSRSADAAEKMRGAGFQKVFELDGGMLKWRAAQLPEVQGSARQAPGMSRAEFDVLMQTDQLVLVDFYADWCEPCQKMAPYLEEINKDMSGHVQVVRINADDNQTLVGNLAIDALPVLLLYKSGFTIWRNTGYVDKEAVMAEIRKGL